MDRAILVGVNEYAKQAGLAGCVNDVLDLERFMVNRRGIDPTNVVVLTDAAATKAAISDALIDMVDALEPGDCGYFHFSGYGVRLPMMELQELDGTSEVLCPHDFDWTPETSFSDMELLVILNALRLGARLVLSIDACHTGDFARGPETRGRARTLTPPLTVRSRGPTVRGFRSAAHAPNVSFIAGCSPWQPAVEATFDGRPNGAFTYFLLGALAANRGATVADAVAAIEKPLRDYAMSPVADNAHVPYFGPKSAALAVTAVRAGMIVFERRWQTSLFDQDVWLDVRVAATNGELAAVVNARAFGHVLTAPPIGITGNRTSRIHLGVLDAHVALRIANWTTGRGTVDFLLQLELITDRAFVPRTRIPVHIDFTRLTLQPVARVCLPECSDG